MKSDMKSDMKASFLFVCILILLTVSCNREPDTETIRLYVRASEAYAEGRFSETTEMLNAIKYTGYKKIPPALILRAKAEYFSGDLESAEKSCRRALRLRPALFEARLYLARILREKNDHGGASVIIESLLADNPQDIRTLRLAAEFAIEGGKFDEAAVFLDRAAEFSAESAMVLLDRARLHWIAGRRPQALEDLSRARAMLPWDTPLLRTISNLENTIRRSML